MNLRLKAIGRINLISGSDCAAGAGSNCRPAEQGSAGSGKIDFHLRVCEGYQQVRERFHDRMIVIDASKPADQVIDACLEVIGALIDREVR